MKKEVSIELVSFFEKQINSKRVDLTVLFALIKRKYKALDIALLYNYILENKTDKKILNYVIKEINKDKYIDNYQSLLNFLTNSDDADLKVLAIKTLTKYKNAALAPVLLGLLNDKNSNYKVRLTCADALGKLGDKTVFNYLKNIVDDEDEKSTYVKESALVALGNLGDERAIDVFSSIIFSKKMFLDKFSFLKERVLEAISKLDVSKNTKALEIIEKTLQEPSCALRISAIETLMNINCEKSYELIYDRLKFDEDYEVRKNALIALYNISDRKILDEVINGNFEDALKAQALEIIKEYEENYE